MQENNFPEGAFYINEEPYFSEPVGIEGLTIEFFEYHASIAKEKGFTNWATHTSKDAQPWTTILAFFRKRIDEGD